MDMGWSVVPTSALNTQQKISIPTVTVKEAGYIFVYLSYEDESNNYVEFDDMKITYTPTGVIQYNEYYPFGLQTANSWTRENVTGNRYLYNGKELQSDNALNWYDYGARMYDPVIGRWNAIDPMSEKYRRWSPYNYAVNNPIRNIDPDGMEVYYGDAARAFLGALIAAMPSSDDKRKSDEATAEFFNRMMGNDFISSHVEASDDDKRRQAQGRPGPIDIWSTDQNVLNGLAEHFLYQNQNGGTSFTWV